jgi:hypothetical protein
MAASSSVSTPGASPDLIDELAELTIEDKGPKITFDKQPYHKHKPLTGGPGAFRLVQLEPLGSDGIPCGTLRETYVGGGVGYTAISYVWGPLANCITSNLMTRFSKSGRIYIHV